MRIAGPDVILFVVGLVLFGGAGYALVQQGGAGVLGQTGSATGAYTVTFPLETVEVGEAPVQSYQSASATFQVNATNVKTVIATLRCTDQVPGGTFNLRVEVTGPNGLASEPTFGQCNTNLEVKVPVATPPSSAATQGRTPEEARENLGQDANATLAQGDWVVKVTGSRGGTSLPGLPAAGTPSGSILLSVERWEPELSPILR